MRSQFRQTDPLPPLLNYLEPVRRQLAKIKPEEIDETTDLSVLRRVLKKRLRGLSHGERKQGLEQDAAALEQWLSDTERKTEPLWFILPLLDVDIAEALLERRGEEPPSLLVSMETPPKARQIGEPPCLTFRLGKTHLLLMASAADSVDLHIANLRRMAEAFPISQNAVLEEVRLGEVQGLKLTRSETGEHPWKGIDYVLQVPGGHVSGNIQSPDSAFDELQFEEYFQTIRITARPT